MAGKAEKIIKRQHLDNGMEIILYDRSRPMVGDRWQVELQCEAYIPIEDSYWKTAAQEDQWILKGIRNRLGGRLVQTFSKKRTFVAEEERQRLLQEMVQQVYSGLMEYLKRPEFPLRLFKKQYLEARQKLLLQQAMDRMAEG